MPGPRLGAMSSSPEPRPQPQSAVTPRTRVDDLPAPAYGSDVIVGLLRQLGVEYAALNPGATFRGLHDSLVNYGGNTAPEIIECTHEEISVAIAHGYAKAAGKPMAAIVHNIVGLQHASMAMFNAWCDREPILVLGGTGPMDLTTRRPWIDWIHTGLVQGNLVRDIVKWDDQPANLDSVPESLVRGWQIMTTEPKAPIYICYDATIQDEALADGTTVPSVDGYAAPTRLQADPTALDTLADWLVAAERPVLMAEFLGRNRETVPVLEALADALAAAVLDKGTRVNCANNHPMDLTGDDLAVLREADVILALDVRDFYGQVSERDRETLHSRLFTGREAKLAHIHLNDMLIRSLVHDYQRLMPMDLNVVADTSLALPALLERVQARLQGESPAARDRRQARRAAHSRQHQAIRDRFRQQARDHAGTAPVHPSWLALQLGEVLQDVPWLLSNGGLGGWVRKTWTIDRPGSYLGTSGGGGLGYGPGASLGAALAVRGTDTVVVNIQSDGDFLFTPSALWTAAHHQIPVLTVMYNNRSYYNSEEHAGSVARIRGRDPGNAPVGTAIREPDVDYAAMTRSFGLWAEGPITDPAEVRPALERALAEVQAGRFALVDIVCGNDHRGR